MAVAFSPDSRRLASAGASASGCGVNHLWDVTTGEPAWSADDHSMEELAVSFAPDGSLLATAGADGLITLRDPLTGSLGRNLEGHKGGATSVAFSGDGAVVCAGASDERAYLWEVRTGRLIRTIRPSKPLQELALQGHERLITSVALSADGGTLVTCSGSESPEYGDRQVRVWDSRSGELRREFSRPQSRGRFVALSSDGTVLATNGTGKSIALWEVKTGRLLGELVGHPHAPQSAAFSADGRLLVSGADYRTTMVWEVATRRLLTTLVTFSEGHPGKATDDWLAYSPDGFYDGSSDVGRYLVWWLGGALRTPDTLGPQLHRPDRLASALKKSVPRPVSP
jgi:WD40 repeat protein